MYISSGGIAAKYKQHFESFHDQELAEKSEAKLLFNSIELCACVTLSTF